MRFTVGIKQNVPRFDVAMENSVLVRVMHRSSYLCNQFRRPPDRHRRALNYFVELSAFDELHAEVARAVALTDFVDRNDTGMLQTRRGLCFKTKALQMRFARPLTEANDF